jgi:small subunit ribosomal protein S20
LKPSIHLFSKLWTEYKQPARSPRPDFALFWLSGKMTRRLTHEIVFALEEFTLANTRSAKKEIRKNSRRRSRNRLVRAKTRTLIKQANRTIESGDPGEIQSAVRSAQQELDAAAQKGIIHRNAAARRKSRLMRRARTGAN